MGKKEFRKKFISGEHWTSRLMYWLYVSDFKILEKRSLSGYSYKRRTLNWWNPLSYIILTISIPIAIVTFIVTEILPEIIHHFKYR